MKWLALFLCVVLLISPVFAETTEASVHSSLNFWQQFDIIFWQTAPFATLWMYFADSQLSRIMYPGAGPHWNAVLTLATILSVGNAWIYASEVAVDTH
ncbi:MAG: hypothetical protein U9R38_05410 [Candidatus Margulisiibacteriota bacterium]|nr:hypothetical protein [Candidatus Margulisiibacteriota bacterium]